MAPNQTLDSAETKRFFRESVRKAIQEYRNERTIELSTENVAATEAIDTGRISNPNNELTVTYLFYELQRRVEISEQLHCVTPVRSSRSKYRALIKSMKGGCLRTTGTACCWMTSCFLR